MNKFKRQTEFNGFRCAHCGDTLNFIDGLNYLEKLGAQIDHTNSCERNPLVRQIKNLLLEREDHHNEIRTLNAELAAEKKPARKARK